MKGKARMFFFFRFICVLAALVIIPCVAYADVPGTISYQGYLEDSEDNPLNETVSMVFKIYDADGAVKWTETHDAVDVNDGVFSVILGETTAVSTDVADDKRYLGVTVESNEEMAPRQKLNSVMFAIRAESVAAKAVGTEEIADNAVTSSKINNNAVTSEKIVSGAALKNLGGGSTTSNKSVLRKDGTWESIASTLSDTELDLKNLTVTEKIKVGTNSLYLNGSAQPAGTPDNSIHTDNDPLYLQSKSGNAEDTIINANNAGNVGIGTDDPNAKLDVKGIIKATSEPVPANFIQTFGKGLYIRYDENGKDSGGDIGVINTDGYPNFERLFLTGRPTLINAVGEAGNVGIGPFVEYDASGNASKVKSPQNNLDVAGSVAIGTGYAGEKIAPNDGLLVEKFAVIGNDKLNDSLSFYSGADSGLFVSGKVAIGYEDEMQLYHNVRPYDAKLFVNGGLRAKKGDTDGDGSNVGYAFDGDGDTGMFAVGGEYVQNSDLYFKIDDQTRLVVRDNGRVGIGTDDPTAKLTINGGNSHALHANVYHDHDWGYSIISTVSRDNTKAFAVRKWGDGPDKFRVMGNGDVYCRTQKIHSDIKLKKDIKPIESSLEKVLKMRGVTFRFKDREYASESEKEMGFIAQEVEKIVPEVVNTNPDDGLKSVAYQNLIALTVEAMKEQQSQIEELKEENDALKAIICEEFPEKAICQ